MPYLVLLLLAACGHTVRTGAGPLVTDGGKPGLVASFEAGTHLISARRAAMPVGIRFEAAATTDGVQGLVGFTFGANLPAGGRRDDEKRGWGGRLGFATGALVDEDAVALGMRGSLALARGAVRRDGSDGGGCLGSHEKSRMCYAWDRFRFAQHGLELASTFRLVGEDEGLALAGWRISVEVFHEHGVLSDLRL